MTLTKWQPIETASKDGDWIVVAHFDKDCFYWWHRARWHHGQWRTGHGQVNPSHHLPFPLPQFNDSKDGKSNE